ncbi:MAG: DUF6064 family protein [bacterium]
MKVPFTTDEFLSVFTNYNSGIFPIQLIIAIVGFLAVYTLHKIVKNSTSWISAALGFLWIWMGIAYHFTYFTSINKAAWGFGGLFVLQGVLFLLTGVVKPKFEYELNKTARSIIGEFLIIFGLLLYPAIGLIILGDMSKIISLGLPCPTTIFTFGFMILATARFPKYLLIIPSIWALIGLSAVFNFGIYQDLMLIVSAVTADFIILKYYKHEKTAKA